MSFPQPRLVLSLALGLLWPAAAFAQTPTVSPQAAPRQVQIKVIFATASTHDVDKLGINFARVPFPLPAAKPAAGADPTVTQKGTFLQYATGNIVAQLFQTLLHTRGRIVQALLITTSDNVRATIRVGAQIPPQAPQTNFLTFAVGLSVTPRINSDDSITLNLAPQIGDIVAATPATGPRATVLRTVRSGDMMVLAGLPVNRDKPSSNAELLIFVTPVILGTDAPKMDAGQPNLPSPPDQDTSPTPNKTVSMDVSAGDLRAVVAMLERQVNLKASVRDGDKPFKPVYVHLEGVSVTKALRTIARSAGAKVSENKDGVYVFEPLSTPADGGDVSDPPLPAPTTVAPANPHGGQSVTVTP